MEHLLPNSHGRMRPVEKVHQLVARLEDPHHVNGVGRMVQHFGARPVALLVFAILEIKVEISGISSLSLSLYSVSMSRHPSGLTYSPHARKALVESVRRLFRKLPLLQYLSIPPREPSESSFFALATNCSPYCSTVVSPPPRLALLLVHLPSSATPRRCSGLEKRVSCGANGIIAFERPQLVSARRPLSPDFPLVGQCPLLRLWNLPNQQNSRATYPMMHTLIYYTRFRDVAGSIVCALRLVVEGPRISAWRCR